MPKQASKMQEKLMALKFRGKEIFKPLNTGWIDEHVGCIREFVANIFFYTKNEVTIMIDAGYNYDRLAEKMKWLDLDPAQIKHALITRQDTDHVGAVERYSDGLLCHATLYIGEVENRYLTKEVRRNLFTLRLARPGERGADAAAVSLLGLAGAAPGERFASANGAIQSTDFLWLIEAAHHAHAGQCVPSGLH